MKAWWNRLLKNEIGLHIHVRNTNNITTVKHFLENYINAIKSKNKRKDNAKSRLWIDEQCVRDIVSPVYEWKCNPSDPENQNLWTLQTCALASEELVNDFESAYEDGDTLVQDSIDTQLIWKSKSLFDPYPKNNRETFVKFKLPNFEFERYWLLQIYWNRRYGIVVAIANTIFSWQRKRWWDNLYMKRL